MIEWIMQEGDVLITRNANEEDNGSPGFWNHASIYVGNHQVIEAQAAPIDKVIMSDWGEFYHRYPRIRVYRYYNDHDVDGDVLFSSQYRVAAANDARKRLGLPYRAIASIFRHLRKSRRGENCVSVVRKAWIKALGKKIMWKIPDDIVADRMFSLEYEKDQ